MTKLYLLSKKLHRLLVSAVIVSGLAMMTTGIFLKYPSTNPFNPGLIRSLHNNLSIIFSVILFLMASTGLFMYLFPFFNKSRAQK